jgi:hypothetical protein
MRFKVITEELTFEDLEALLADGLTPSQNFKVDTDASHYVEYRDQKYLGDPDNMTFEGVLASILLHDKPIQIIDIGNDDGAKNHELTLQKLKEAFNTCLEKDSETFANIVTENYDYYDVDILWQFAIFGEIVYG